LGKEERQETENWSTEAENYMRQVIERVYGKAREGSPEKENQGGKRTQRMAKKRDKPGCFTTRTGVRLLGGGARSGEERGEGKREKKKITAWEPTRRLLTRKENEEGNLRKEVKRALERRQFGGEERTGERKSMKRGAKLTAKQAFTGQTCRTAGKIRE